ncbi:hypothetical protein GGI16_001727, partial [Coemansia sp. S142-1]
TCLLLTETPKTEPSSSRLVAHSATLLRRLVLTRSVPSYSDFSVVNRARSKATNTPTLTGTRVLSGITKLSLTTWRTPRSISLEQRWPLLVSRRRRNVTMLSLTSRRLAS